MSHARCTLAIATLVAFSSAAFVPCPGGEASAEAVPAAVHHPSATSSAAGHHVPAATEEDGAHAHHVTPKPAVEASRLALVAPCLCGCDEREVTRNNAASPRLDAALADTRPAPRDARPIAHAGEFRLAVPSFSPNALDPVPI